MNRNVRILRSGNTVASVQTGRLGGIEWEVGTRRTNMLNTRKVPRTTNSHNNRKRTRIVVRRWLCCNISQTNGENIHSFCFVFVRECASCVTYSTWLLLLLPPAHHFAGFDACNCVEWIDSE